MIFLVSIGISCRKDVDNSDPLLEKAKSIYNLNERDILKSFSNNYVIRPKWENSVRSNLNDKSSVIKIEIGQGKSLGLLELVLSLDEEGILKNQIVETIPEGNSFNNKNSFSGIKSFYNQSGKFKVGAIFKKGTYFESYVPKDYLNDLNKKNISGRISNEAIDLDEVVVIGHRQGSSDYYFITIPFSFYIPTGGVYNDPYSGLWIYLPSGSGIPAPTADNWENIIRKNVPPCIKDVLNQLTIYAQGNSVGDIVQTFSNGRTPTFNWTLNSGPLTNGAGASTTPVVSNGVVTTTFDLEKLGNASDISIARTILHESIHAFLVWEFRTNPNANTSGTYAELIFSYRQSQNLNYSHHAYMPIHVNNIAAALKQYGVSKGYNYSDQFYNDMAWGGLTHDSVNSMSSSFMNAVPSASDRTRILHTLAIEQSGKDMNGNPQSQHGTKINCN
ncbi:hypothetical protein C5O19_24470 [Siphonobacter curvatus]|uniref:Uncharacterized protein n=2 Tax=Siphonobacter curvatus TaxID=2094562 RepID=A0A2S7IES6_9BACT|nr:hypothetical protein C5O19_24470 [Siphonobacter curvatus]